MQKWEYLFLEASPYPFGDKLISLYVNGEELRDWKQGSLHLFVTQLGDEGWELVALHHDSKYDHNYLIFKRPKVVKKTRKTKEPDTPKKE
jgi:hypothetical protein